VLACALLGPTERSPRDVTRRSQPAAPQAGAPSQPHPTPDRHQGRAAQVRAGTRLDDLGAQQAELAENDSDGSRAPTADDLAAVAGRLETLIADGQPEQTKALLRLLIAELRVNSKADIQPTYRVLTPDRFLTAGFAQRPKKWAVQESNLQPWA
jgi:hypothetical protein